MPLPLVVDPVTRFHGIRYLSPPSGPATLPVRGAARVLPGGTRGGIGALEELRRKSGAGDAGWRGLRRRGHRPGPLELLPPRLELRRHHRREGRREEQADARRAAGAVLRPDPEESAEAHTQSGFRRSTGREWTGARLPGRPDQSRAAPGFAQIPGTFWRIECLFGTTARNLELRRFA